MPSTPPPRRPFSYSPLLPRRQVRVDRARKKKAPNRRTPHRKGGVCCCPASLQPTHRHRKRTQMTQSTLAKPSIAIVGYGSHGRAHALNLRDPGLDRTLRLRPAGPTEAHARPAGFTVHTPAEAAEAADPAAVLTPAMVQRKVYEEALAPNMRQGACLLFAHGLNVHYGMLAPREDLDVILVAPKGPGALVRREYEIGRGVPCIYA